MGIPKRGKKSEQALAQAGQQLVPHSVGIAGRGTKSSGFLFPTRGVSKVYRAIYLTAFRDAWLAGKLKVPPRLLAAKTDPKAWCRKRWRQAWVVYAKAPFKGPDTVVEYLGRYTHKTAISNHRLLDLASGKVAFRYKDYRDSGKQKIMRLEGVEFCCAVLRALRRFCQHILPHGFTRIRHYGILANTLKARALAAARKSLGLPVRAARPARTRAERKLRILEDLLDHAIDDCPDCGAVASLVRILIPPTARAPPRIAFNHAGV